MRANEFSWFRRFALSTWSLTNYNLWSVNLRWFPNRGHFATCLFNTEKRSESHRILFLDQLWVFFCQSGIVVWQYFKVTSKTSIINEKVFFAEKQLLRERFKVVLKETGKEKMFWNYFHRFNFHSPLRLHLLHPTHKSNIVLKHIKIFCLWLTNKFIRG